MRRSVATAIFAILGASGVAADGGHSASAAMLIVSDLAVATAEAAEIPAMEAPTVKLVSQDPQISWSAVRVGMKVPADRYVVVRTDDGRAEIACVGDAATRSCRDRGAAPGDTVTYTVHATKGVRWRGPDSKPSQEIAVPGTATSAEPTL